MRLRQLHHQSPAGKINVTPLIDVMMVLIVFYLIVGKLAADRREQVALPASAVGASDEAEAIEVTVAPAAPGSDLARITLAGREVSEAELEAALRALIGPGGAAPSVRVRADRRLRYGAVAPVVAACRGAGLTSVTLVTERTAPGGPS